MSTPKKDTAKDLVPSKLGSIQGQPYNIKHRYEALWHILAQTQQPNPDNVVPLITGKLLYGQGGWRGWRGSSPPQAMQFGARPIRV